MTDNDSSLTGSAAMMMEEGSVMVADVGLSVMKIILNMMVRALLIKGCCIGSQVRGRKR